MFAVVPVYNTLLSEDRIIQTEHIEQVMPHANVPVDPGAVDTAACEAIFHSGTSIIILLSLGAMQERLQALTGIINTFGDIT